MKNILNKNRNNIALIIGNGINLYGAGDQTNSWHNLLIELANKRLKGLHNKIPKGVALTEFYDVLELKKLDRISKTACKRNFAN